MEENRKRAGYGNPAPVIGEVAGPREVVSEFLNWYTREEIQEELLDLLLAAVNSEEAENWDHFIRARVIFLYRQLSGLVSALYNEQSPGMQSRTH